MSHDPSEIIRICWFGTQEHFWLSAILNKFSLVVPEFEDPNVSNFHFRLVLISVFPSSLSYLDSQWAYVLWSTVNVCKSHVLNFILNTNSKKEHDKGFTMSNKNTDIYCEWGSAEHEMYCVHQWRKTALQRQRQRLAEYLFPHQLNGSVRQTCGLLALRLCDALLWARRTSKQQRES